LLGFDAFLIGIMVGNKLPSYVKILKHHVT